MKQSSQQLIKPLVQQQLLQISAPRRDFPVLCAASLPLLVAFVVLLASCTGFHNTHLPKIYRDYSRYSYVDSVPVNDSTIENLAVLGKVWGFVKYYHPVFEDSVFNVDYELFELLPKIIPADYTTRNQVLCDWIDSLGTFETDEGYYQKILADTTVRKMVSYDWMNDSDKISPELSGRLNRLVYARRTGSNVYAGIAKRKESLAEVYRFSRENAYGNLIFLDDGYRLLALFRYWNMVEYYFPSKHLIEKRWDDILLEYIPAFIKTHFFTDYRISCHRLFSEIRDSHANVRLSCELYGYKQLPLKLKYIDKKWIITHQFNKDTNRLFIGNEIISIDGKCIDSLAEIIRLHTSYSNENSFRRDAAMTLCMTTKDSARIVIEEGDVLSPILLSTHSVDIVSRLNPNTNPLYRRINDSTTYLCFGEEFEKHKVKILDLIKRTTNLIVDLRYYGDQQLGEFIKKYLLQSRVLLMTGYGEKQENFPGCVKKIDVRDPTKHNNWKYSGKMIILVNEYTQSYYEQLAVFLKSNSHAIVIGEQTAGAVGAMIFITLPGNIRTYITGDEIYTPSGILVQRLGVPLDEEVLITIKGIREGRDEVYERALELVKTL